MENYLQTEVSMSTVLSRSLKQRTKQINKFLLFSDKGGPEYEKAQSLFLREYPNYETLIEILNGLQITDPDLAKEFCTFVIASNPFLINLPPSSRLKWMVIALELVYVIKNDSDIQVEIILHLASTHWFLGNIQEAIELYLDVQTLFGHSTDPDLKSQVLGNLGLAYRNLGEFQLAIELLDKCLSMSDNPEIRHVYLAIRGRCYHHLEDFEEARLSYLEALKIAHSFQNFRAKADILINLGLVYAQIEHVKIARNLYKKALHLSRLADFKRGESNVLIRMADIDLKVHNYSGAINIAEMSLLLCIEAQYTKGALRSYLILSKANFHKKRFFQSGKYLLELFRQYFTLGKNRKNYPLKLWFYDY